MWCPQGYPVTNFTTYAVNNTNAYGSGSPVTNSTTYAITNLNDYGSSLSINPFTQALRQAPDVAAAIWPSKLDTTDTISTATLPDWLLNGANQSVITSLEAGLDVIMNDAGTFIAFAGEGVFSHSPVSTAATFDQTGALAALNTYLVSEILRTNSISVTARQIEVSSGCGTDLCTESYWSPVTGRQYYYTGGETVYDFLQQMADNKGLNLPVLFDGAYNCTVAGTVGESIVSINPDSTLNVGCLSALPVTLGEQ